MHFRKKKESVLRAKKEMRKKESALRAKKRIEQKRKKKHIAREKKLKKATRANISLINQTEAIHASARHKN